MAKLKWSNEGIDEYKKAGDVMCEAGMKPLREIPDSEATCVLTFWASKNLGAVIQQTWVDTGDVCFYRSTTLDDVIKGQ